jgi:hypothetical protein
LDTTENVDETVAEVEKDPSQSPSVVNFKMLK